jgi:hypothetical protein
MYFLMSLVSSGIISSALNVFVSLIVQNEYFHVQPNTLSVFNMFFQHPIITCYILSFLVGKPLFLLFPIFCHHWCYSNVFLLLINYRSSPNQNIPSI